MKSLIMSTPASPTREQSACSLSCESIDGGGLWLDKQRCTKIVKHTEKLMSEWLKSDGAGSLRVCGSLELSSTHSSRPARQVYRPELGGGAATQGEGGGGGKSRTQRESTSGGRGSGDNLICRGRRARAEMHRAAARADGERRSGADTLWSCS